MIEKGQCCSTMLYLIICIIIAFFSIQSNCVVVLWFKLPVGSTTFDFIICVVLTLPRNILISDSGFQKRLTKVKGDDNKCFLITTNVLLQWDYVILKGT